MPCSTSEIVDSEKQKEQFQVTLNALNTTPTPCVHLL
jgi:hypothetical protein